MTTESKKEEERPRKTRKTRKREKTEEGQEHLPPPSFRVFRVFRGLSLCLCGSLFLLLPGRVFAGLDPELKKPYQLEVVLHLSKQRMLTDVFRERITRELRDSLQEALGELARVTVVSKHPKLADVLSKGLKRALDEWKDRSGVKTHFVLIDHVGENYEIQARQQDGLTGLSSPVVRRDRTRDRNVVPKAAALLIAQDFGLVGTVRLPADPNELRVDLKGSSLGVPLSPLVKKGEVFALVQIPARGTGIGKGADVVGTGRQVPWTVLQVLKPPGEAGPECVCRLFAPNPGRLNETPAVAGYRCLKIATGKFPLRIQLMQAGVVPLAAIEEPMAVQVRRLGFDDPSPLQRPTSEGVLDTTRMGDDGLFENLAFVTVPLRDGRLARVPVALVGDQSVQIPLSVTSDPAEQLRFRQDGWARAVADSLLVQNFLFVEIRDLSSKAGQRTQVLTRTREALKRSKDDITRLESEKGELIQEASELTPGRPLNLAVSEDRLRKIQQGQRELGKFLAQLEKIDKDENDPARRKLLGEIERARLLVGKADVPQALEIYDQVIKDGLGSADIKEEAERLRKLWQPASEQHRRARQFIYETWSATTLDVRQLNEKREEARQALEVCKKAKDLFGVKKHLDATVEHGGRLQTLLDKLNPVNVEEEKQIEEIQKLAPKLRDLAVDAENFLKNEGGEKK